MHGRGTKRALVRGYSPRTWVRMSIQKIVCPRSLCSGVAKGTLFSVLQATAHDWQAVHLSRSITIPQRMPLASFLGGGVRPPSDTSPPDTPVRPPNGRPQRPSLSAGTWSPLAL